MHAIPDISTSATFYRRTGALRITGNNQSVLTALPGILLFLITVTIAAGSNVFAQSTGSLESTQQNSLSLVATLVPMMENPRNPLLELSTSEGDIYFELFPDAAPAGVRRVLELASGQLAPSPTGAYYNGLTFHRTVPGHFLQTGAAERAGRLRPPPIADEINARGLGLEQQKLLDASGKPHPWMNIADKEDFQNRVLAPLYRSMNINNPDQLLAQQDNVILRLRDMNLLQVHELSGYRYNGSLPSRRPAAGSVILASHGPGTNDGELLLSLVDAPWLTPTHTVIGRVISGLALATSISRQPESSVRIYHIRQLDTSAIDIPLPGSSLQPEINNVQIQP